MELFYVKLFLCISKNVFLSIFVDEYYFLRNIHARVYFFAFCTNYARFPDNQKSHTFSGNIRCPGRSNWKAFNCNPQIQAGITICQLRKIRIWMILVWNLLVVNRGEIVVPTFRSNKSCDRNFTMSGYPDEKVKDLTKLNSAFLTHS